MVVLGVVATGVLKVHAAATDDTGTSLTTSPVFLDISVPPGTTDTRTLQLMNNGKQPLTINMKLDVFTAQGDQGDAKITAPEPNDPSVSWVSFSPSTFVAKPGVWSAVKMTIALPTSATLGYYYAVLFQPDVQNQPSPKTASIRGSNAILVLVDTHSGSEKRQLEIKRFTSDHGFYEYLPTTFTVVVQNNGNIYMSPYGNVYVSKNSDITDTIAAIPLNPDAGNILPNSGRSFQVSWSDGFPVFADKKVDGQVILDKNGNPEKQLSWGFVGLNKIRFGQYYAKVTIVYSDGVRIIPISQVISFWVIPWKLIIITILVLVVLVIGLQTIGRYAFHLIRHARAYRK